jgi:RNA polymerase sigma factor (sigma-70 family)
MDDRRWSPASPRATAARSRRCTAATAGLLRAGAPHPGDEQLAQDAVQEVFLTVWRDASRFDASRGGFSTWLLSMTHHKAVDSVRREENLRKRRTTADALEHRESDAPRVDDAVWSLLRRERVREVLQTLPDPAAGGADAGLLRRLHAARDRRSD